MLKLTQKISVVQYPTKNAYTRDVRCVRSSTNPCDRNQCKEGGDEHAECVPESFTTYRCSCDSAGEGYFWNNETKACENPCNDNICGTAEHSVCTPTSATTFTCSCNTDGFFWDESFTTCKDPCDPNPCNSLAHATKICTITSAGTFTCGCDDGYAWANSQCSKTRWSFEYNEEIPATDNWGDWSKMDVLGAKTGEDAFCSTNFQRTNSTSTVYIILDMPAAGVVSLYIKGEAETSNLLPHYDVFTLDIDSNNKLRNTSGSTSLISWTKKTYSLSAGRHTLKLTYKKDNVAPFGDYSINDNGYDRFCIDDLEISW